MVTPPTFDTHKQFFQYNYALRLAIQEPTMTMHICMLIIYLVFLENVCTLRL